MADGIWIHLCGGNASGKTTLLQTIRAERPHGETFRYVFADSGGAEVDEQGKRIRGSGKLHDKYKMPKEIQWQAILEDWNSEVPVIISDGTRVHYAIRNAHQIGTRKRRMVVIALYQKPEVMKAHLQARCAKRGKVFKEKFWNLHNLTDIGRVHWERFYKKYPLPFEFYEFEVDLGFSVLPEVGRLIRQEMAQGKLDAWEARGDHAEASQ